MYLSMKPIEQPKKSKIMNILNLELFTIAGVSLAPPQKKIHPNWAYVKSLWPKTSNNTNTHLNAGVAAQEKIEFRRMGYVSVDNRARGDVAELPVQVDVELGEHPRVMAFLDD